MRSMLSECIVLESELSELYEYSVHQTLSKWQQTVHEANMAASTSGDQNKVRILPSLLLRDGWRRNSEERE